MPNRPLATGRTAEVFDLDDGTVVKLLRDGFDPSMIDVEAARTAAANAAGAPTAVSHGTVDIGGRRGVVFGRVEGELLLDEAVGEPFRLRSWGKKLGDIHAEVLSHTSPDLPPLKDVLAERIDMTDLPPAHKAAAKERLSILPESAAVLHGDFHPGNVILTDDGPVLIDWIDATRGAPAADIARTLWLLSPATVSDGVANRRIMTTVQSIFRRAYRTRVMRRSGASPLEVELWQLPVIAARVAEDIDHEDASLRQEVKRLAAGTSN
jgi:Ser/Thr protein kinase RdoA (MazF antagonist)